MGKTAIEWTDETWNPIRGTQGRWHCTHVSEGCRNCYAERLNVRWGGPEYKPGADTFRLDAKILNEPRHWRKPRRVFGFDMTDLFHEQIPREWIKAVNGVTVDCPTIIFQFLTKRAARMQEEVTVCPFPPNVWMGVSVEDQKTADERIPLLLQTPAAVRFVSYEPALGPVSFTRLHHDGIACSALERGVLIREKIDWLIVGGESSPEARPMHPAWARSARDQCQAAGVPFFFKQWGEWAYGSSDDPDPKGRTWALWPDGRFTNEWEPGPHMKGAAIMFKVGKKRAGRLLDGREWNEFPEKKDYDHH